MILFDATKSEDIPGLSGTVGTNAISEDYPLGTAEIAGMGGIC